MAAELDGAAGWWWGVELVEHVRADDGGDAVEVFSRYVGRQRAGLDRSGGVDAVAVGQWEQADPVEPGGAE